MLPVAAEGGGRPDPRGPGCGRSQGAESCAVFTTENCRRLGRKPARAKDRSLSRLRRVRYTRAPAT